jgi:hypothetical protein
MSQSEMALFLVSGAVAFVIWMIYWSIIATREMLAISRVNHALARDIAQVRAISHNADNARYF